jgi:hypothetical protein
MHPSRRFVAAGTVLLGLGLAGLSGAQTAFAARARTVSPISFRGDGLGNVRFGEKEQLVVADLERLLGRAPHPAEKDAGDANCGYDAFLSWPGAQAWFFRGTFVGYAASVSRTHQVNGVTARGLRIGDTLGRARRLYGHSLRSSTEQGGAWFATTDTGQIAGFLSDNPVMVGDAVRITSIGAGIEGCPAMGP